MGYWNQPWPRQDKKPLKINVSSFIYSFIATIVAGEVDYGAENDMKEESCIELDYHANMSVVGQHVHVISDTGHIAEVNPFTLDYEATQIPIIYAAVRYDLT